MRVERRLGGGRVHGAGNCGGGGRGGGGGIKSRRLWGRGRGRGIQSRRLWGRGEGMGRGPSEQEAVGEGGRGMGRGSSEQEAVGEGEGLQRGCRKQKYKRLSFQVPFLFRWNDSGGLCGDLTSCYYDSGLSLVNVLW